MLDKTVKKFKSFDELKQFVASTSEGVEVHIDGLASAMGLPKGSLEFVLVRPSELKGDTSYQRHPTSRGRLIHDIAKNFDMRAFEFPHVRYRPNGDKVIVDGWGRIWARYNIRKDDTPILCIHHLHLKTVEDEAKWFGILNKRKKKVNKSEIFKAAVVAGDKRAVHLVKTAKIGGLTINSGKQKTRISEQSAEFLDHLGLLVEVAEIKQSAWPNEGVGNPIWNAIGALVYATPNIDKTRLIHVLRELTPKRLELKAMDKYSEWPHARTGANRIAAYIALLYNYRLDDSRKIKPMWYRVNDMSKDMPYRDRWAFCQIEIQGDKP